jgi:hypothetical protein
VSRDWNIVDDEPAETPPPDADDDARLNLNRVRLVALERRSANRQRQWSLGAAALAMLAAITLIEQAVAWRGARPQWAMAAVVAAIMLAVLSLRTASKRVRR